MGKPMARNLLKAGHAVTVHNRSRPAVDELAAEGATAGNTPREVAERSDVVITMVPDSPDVEAVVLGPDGVIEGAKAGTLVIDMSTIAPGAAIRIGDMLRERGMRMLDAPVSGGDKGAIAGTLSIMVGGDRADFEQAMPIFETLGKTITYCGPSGAGQTVKACNQALIAQIITGISEALVLGSKAGVDPAIIVKVLSGGMAQNRILDLRGMTMIDHTFEPGFKARMHLKDLGIVMQTARENGAALPGSALAAQLFTSLIESGKGEMDNSSLLTVLEALSHHEIGNRREGTGNREQGTGETG
jgi:2-hydroxy-3-oxopropionate reductase